MASLNKVTVIGYLGKDPEVRYLPSGDAVANISVATSEKWKNKNGDEQEHTEWHRINFFGKLAEIVGEYLKKGGQVYVEGRIRTRKWKDKESGQDRYSTEINADRMLMLGAKSSDTDRSGSGSDNRYAQEKGRPGGKPQPQSGRGPAGGAFDQMDDDIPF